MTGQKWNKVKRPFAMLMVFVMLLLAFPTGVGFAAVEDPTAATEDTTAATEDTTAATESTTAATEDTTAASESMAAASESVAAATEDTTADTTAAEDATGSSGDTEETDPSEEETEPTEETTDEKKTFTIRVEEVQEQQSLWGTIKSAAASAYGFIVGDDSASESIFTQLQFELTNTNGAAFSPAITSTLVKDEKSGDYTLEFDDSALTDPEYRLYIRNVPSTHKIQGDSRQWTASGADSYYTMVTADELKGDGGLDMVLVKIAGKVIQLSPNISYNNEYLVGAPIRLTEMTSDGAVPGQEEIKYANDKGYVDWFNLPAGTAAGEKVYYIYIQAPTETAYLALSSTELDGAEYDSAYTKLVTNADGKEVREYRFKFDSASMITNGMTGFMNTFQFFDVKGDLTVEKQFDVNVPDDLKGKPIWIGLRATKGTDKTIDWVKMEYKDGKYVAVFTDKDRYHVDVSGHLIDPDLQMTAYELFEYAPSGMQPQPVNAWGMVFEDPPEEARDLESYTMWKRSLTYQVERNSYKQIEIIINEKGTWEFINLIDMEGAIQNKAFVGYRYKWNAAKKAWFVENDETKLMLDQSRTGEYEVDYQVVFTRTEKAKDEQAVLYFENIQAKLVYDKRASVGNNWVRSTFTLYKEVDGTMVPVSGDNATYTVDMLLTNGIKNTDNTLKLTVPSNTLSDPEYVPGTVYKVKVDSTYYYNDEGTGTLGDPAGFTTAEAQNRDMSSTINVTVETKDENSPTDGSLTGFTDTISVNTGLKNIVGLESVSLNGAALQSHQYEFDPATGILKIKVTKLQVAPGTDKVTIDYRVKFKDEVSYKSEPCATGYDINNTASAKGDTTGSTYTAEAEVEVAYDDYAYFTADKFLVNKGLGTTARETVTFALLDSAGNEIAYAVTDKDETGDAPFFFVANKAKTSLRYEPRAGWSPELYEQIFKLHIGASDSNTFRVKIINGLDPNYPPFVDADGSTPWSWTEADGWYYDITVPAKTAAPYTGQYCGPQNIVAYNLPDTTIEIEKTGGNITTSKFYVYSGATKVAGPVSPNAEGKASVKGLDYGDYTIYELTSRSSKPSGWTEVTTGIPADINPTANQWVFSTTYDLSKTNANDPIAVNNDALNKLIIEKSMDGMVHPSSSTFTFQVYKSSEPTKPLRFTGTSPNYTYTTSTTAGTTDLTLDMLLATGAKTITVSNLPDDTYIVKELKPAQVNDIDVYTWTEAGFTKGGLVIKWFTDPVGNDVTASFINKSLPGNGSIQVTKTATGYGADTDEFEFSLMGAPNVALQITDSTAPYYLTIGGNPADASRIKNINTFTLKSGETAKIENLPLGVKFTVKEAVYTGYSTSYQIKPAVDYIDGTEASGMIIGKDGKYEYEVTFKNERTPGSLTVNKTTVGADEDDVFIIKVDGTFNTGAGTQYFVFAKTVLTSPPAGIPDGAAVKYAAWNGATGLTVDNVLAGEEYTITEMNQDGVLNKYRVEAADSEKGLRTLANMQTVDEDADGSFAKVGIQKGKDHVVTFTNTRAIFDLTLNKTVTEHDGTTIYPDGFEFSLYRKDTDKNWSSATDVQLVETKTANSDNSWSVTWNDLNNRYDYRVYETGNSNYFAKSDGWIASNSAVDKARGAYYKVISLSNDEAIAGKKTEALENGITKLTVTKTVETGKKDETFTFQVMDKDGNAMTFTRVPADGTLEYYLYDANASLTDIEFKDGAPVTLMGLPLGTYTVTETNTKGHASSGDSAITFSKTDFEEEATIVNNFSTDNSKLTINKVITNIGGYENQAFQVAVKENKTDGKYLQFGTDHKFVKLVDEAKDALVTITVSKPVTLTGLPVAESATAYVVEEHNIPEPFKAVKIDQPTFRYGESNVTWSAEATVNNEVPGDDAGKLQLQKDVVNYVDGDEFYLAVEGLFYNGASKKWEDGVQYYTITKDNISKPIDVENVLAGKTYVISELGTKDDISTKLTANTKLANGYVVTYPKKSDKAVKTTETTTPILTVKNSNVLFNVSLKKDVAGSVAPAKFDFELFSKSKDKEWTNTDPNVVKSEGVKSASAPGWTVEWIDLDNRLDYRIYEKDTGVYFPMSDEWTKSEKGSDTGRGAYFKDLTVSEETTSVSEELTNGTTELVVKKTVESGNNGETFTFQVLLEEKIPGYEQINKKAMKFSKSADGAYYEYDSTGGSADLSIKHGETVKLVGLPFGEYSISETDAKGHTPSIVYAGEDQSSVVFNKEHLSDTVGITNNFSNEKTQMSITKTVTNMDGARDFYVAVKENKTDGQYLKFTGGKYDGGKTDDPTQALVTVKSGAVAGTAGAAVTLTGLPVIPEGYVVEEHNIPAGFVQDGDITQPVFSFSENSTVWTGTTAAVTNKVDDPKGELKVRKRVENSTGADEFYLAVTGTFLNGNKYEIDQVRYYTFTQNGGNGTYAFNQSVKVEGVVEGETYKVDELKVKDDITSALKDGEKLSNKYTVVRSTEVKAAAPETAEADIPVLDVLNTSEVRTVVIEKQIPGTNRPGTTQFRVRIFERTSNGGLVPIEFAATSTANEYKYVTNQSSSNPYITVTAGVQTRLIDIPVGLELVVEEVDYNTDHYSPSYTVNNVAGNTVKIDSGMTYNVVISNQVVTQIIIEKKVQSGNSASASGTYNFEVRDSYGNTMRMDRVSDGVYRYNAGGSVTSIPVTTYSTSESGYVGTGNVTVIGLPYTDSNSNPYTVTETGIPSGYSLVRIDNQTFNLNSGYTTHTVTAINRRDGSSSSSSWWSSDRDSNRDSDSGISSESSAWTIEDGLPPLDTIMDSPVPLAGGIAVGAIIGVFGLGLLGVGAVMKRKQKKDDEK